VMVMHVKDLVSTTLLRLLPLPCCLVLGTGNIPCLKSPVVDQERMWPVMVMHVKDLVSTTLLRLLPLPCCLVLGTGNIPCLKRVRWWTKTQERMWSVMVMYVKHLVSTTLLHLLPLPCCLVLGTGNITGNVPSLNESGVGSRKDVAESIH